MFTFVSSDMRYSSEDISTMSRSAFNAVSMVNATFSSFVIDIEVLQVIVEVDRAGAEVSSQEGCVGSEDSRNINMAAIFMKNDGKRRRRGNVPFSAQRDGQTSLPFVEMGNNSCGDLSGDILGISNR